MKGSSGVPGLAVWRVLRLRALPFAQDDEVVVGGDFMSGLWPSGFVAVLTQGFSAPTSKSARRAPVLPGLGYGRAVDAKSGVGLTSRLFQSSKTLFSSVEGSLTRSRLIWTRA